MALKNYYSPNFFEHAWSENAPKGRKTGYLKLVHLYGELVVFVAGFLALGLSPFVFGLPFALLKFLSYLSYTFLRTLIRVILLLVFTGEVFEIRKTQGKAPLRVRVSLILLIQTVFFFIICFVFLLKPF